MACASGPLRSSADESQDIAERLLQPPKHTSIADYFTFGTGAVITGAAFCCGNRGVVGNVVPQRQRNVEPSRAQQRALIDMSRAFSVASETPRTVTARISANELP